MPVSRLVAVTIRETLPEITVDTIEVRCVDDEGNDQTVKPRDITQASHLLKHVTELMQCAVVIQKLNNLRDQN